MRYSFITFILISALCLGGCGNASKNRREEVCEDSVISCKGAKDSLLMELSSLEDNDCLVYWVSDTVCRTNPELLLLLDSLYQHVRGDEYSEDPRIEEKWMNSYRKRICAYYDKHYTGNEAKSEFEKTDFVLKEGVRLVGLGCEYSPMEMVGNKSVEITFARLSEYGLLTQMIRKCKDNETKNLVYQEWEQLENIRQDMIGIVDGLVRLSYWTGSGGIPIRTERWLDFSDARKIMYQNILNTIDGKTIKDDACYNDDAVVYVTDYLTKTARDIYFSWEKDQNDGSPFMSEKEWKEYQKVAEETEKDINAIRPKLKKWISLWDKLESKLTHNNNQKMPQVASKMLVDWANMASYMEEHRFAE